MIGRQAKYVSRDKCGIAGAEKVSLPSTAAQAVSQSLPQGTQQLMWLVSRPWSDGMLTQLPPLCPISLAPDLAGDGTPRGIMDCYCLCKAASALK